MNWPHDLCQTPSVMTPAWPARAGPAKQIAMIDSQSRIVPAPETKDPLFGGLSLVGRIDFVEMQRVLEEGLGTIPLQKMQISRGGLRPVQCQADAPWPAMRGRCASSSSPPC